MRYVHDGPSSSDTSGSGRSGTCPSGSSKPSGPKDKTLVVSLFNTKLKLLDNVLKQLDKPTA